MNKSFLELESKQAVVANNKGDIKLITKENDNYKFEEILKLENQLEENQKLLNNDKYKLKENELKCKINKIFSCMIVAMEIVIFLIQEMQSMQFQKQGLTYALLGGTKQRQKEKQYLKQNISKEQEKISSLEKELDKMKKQTNYQVIENEKAIINISKKEKVYPNFLEENVKDKAKVKVKTL